MQYVRFTLKKAMCSECKADGVVIVIQENALDSVILCHTCSKVLVAELAKCIERTTPT